MVSALDQGRWIARAHARVLHKSSHSPIEGMRAECKHG